MIKKLLIANRGEIACRIIKTAKALGIETVAVYSQADLGTLHTKLADHACYLGPAPANESYLNIYAIITIATDYQVDAIHPGYGFLAENADFARAIEKAGLIFVGPKADTIEAMGSKSIAKDLMQKAGVPILPGYHGKDNNLSTMQKQAEKIGYPVLIKASAGGGGKGMRIIKDPAQLKEALLASAREAEKNFGSGQLLLEKYLTEPRHIEIQVCVDHQGHGVHLFSRDCSIQRRYQKIIEEAPAQGLPDSMESTMGELAVKAAVGLDYRGVGTFEFLLDSENNFYFMEINTRLQVEHSVTEMISGIDLVEWQLRIASGEAIPAQQNEISKKGHAIEARIYAEDPDTTSPDQRFKPSTGKINTLSLPKETQLTRVDNGIQAGETISPYYDPMISKITCWGIDRRRAIQALDNTLEAYKCTGIKTNRNFLQRIIQSDYFINEKISTHFLEQHTFPAYRPSDEEVQQACMLAAFFCVYKAKYHPEPEKQLWLAQNGWRLNHAPEHLISMKHEGSISCISASVHHTNANLQAGTLTLNMSSSGSGYVQIIGRLEMLNKYSAILHADIKQKKLTVNCHFNNNFITLFFENYSLNIELNPRQTHLPTGGSSKHSDLAPMNGRITCVHSQAKQNLKEGQAIVSMEAMKMEYTLRAPCDGLLDDLLVCEGDLVEEGALLFEFTPVKNM